MAKITIAGNAAVITSSMTLEDLATIKKYQPDALTLMGGKENKDPIFTIDVRKGGCGELNCFGACFADATHDDAKKACITGVLNDVQGDVKEYIADTFGQAYAHLEALEAKLPAVLEKVKADRKAMIEAITTM